MKDDIHNTVLVDSKKDKAVLQSLGDIKKALSDNKKGVKVFNKICYNFGPYLNSVVACLGTILHISTACRRKNLYYHFLLVLCFIVSC